MSKGAILKLNVLDYDITILQNTTQQGCKQRIQIQQLKCQMQLLGSVMLPKAGFILKIGQWGSNGPPSVILGGPFSRKGVPKRYLNFLVQTVPWENEPLLAIFLLQAWLQLFKGWINLSKGKISFYWTKQLVSSYPSFWRTGAGWHYVETRIHEFGNY